MSGVPTVLFVTQAPFVGGAERALIRLAGALDRARYRPFVVAGQRGATLDALHGAGIECVHVRLPPPARAWPLPFVASVLRIAAHLRRQRAAVVHTNDAPAHPAAALAARLLRVPRLCHLHFTYPAAGLRWWLKWGFEQALFASDFARRHTQQQCPELFPAARCAVIPNGFDPRYRPRRRTCTPCARSAVSTRARRWSALSDAWSRPKGSLISCTWRSACSRTTRTVGSSSSATTTARRRTIAPR
jgi:glycosyltransferase involved in cell wall biosynthesis